MADLCSPYLGYYPQGAFLVDSKQALGLLVKELRRQGRLKSGLNVTTFSLAAAFLSAGERGNDEGQSLHSFELCIQELDGKRNDRSCTRHTVITAAGQAESLKGLLCPSSSVGGDARQSLLVLLFAVHATGAWGTEELSQLIASSQPLALAYVHQLRVFSAACRPTDALKSLSPAAQSFHELRALAQRRKEPSDIAKTNFTFSELFGGIGMFRLGLERAGGTASFGVEFAAPARVVYESNFGAADAWKAKAESASLAGADGDSRTVESATAPFATDITEIPSPCFPRHDVLTAGFPCQSFAKAGPADGLHGSKGWLFYEVIRVILASRPKVFLLENVANLVEVEEGAQLSEILRCLRAPSKTRVAELNATGTSGYVVADDAAALTYDVSYRVLDGAVVTPQTRRRVYFIGVRNPSPATASNDGNLPSVPTTTTAEGERIEELFNDAERRLAMIGAQQRYQCVKDLLEPQSPPPPVGRYDRDAHCPSPSHPLALTAAQWATVQRSHTFRQNPRWRLVNVRGKARTLLGSYRTSYQLYSEFLPYPDTLLDLSQEALLSRVTAATTAAAAGLLDQAESSGRQEGDNTERETTERKRRREACLSSDAAPPTASRPPLRFFSLRECARLQGIPDSYRFLTTTSSGDNSGDTDDGDEERPSASGVRKCETACNERRLPPGAVYKLIGNAVNPLVIEALARSITERIHFS